MPNLTPQNLQNKFQPFGKSVRVGHVDGASGCIELAANLRDLCTLHEVDYQEAKALEYPNGGIAMLPTSNQGMGLDLYLCEMAYSTFVLWMNEQQRACDCHE